MLEAGVAGAGSALAEEGGLHRAGGGAAIPVGRVAVVALLRPHQERVPADLQALVAPRIEAEAGQAARAADRVVSAHLDDGAGGAAVDYGAVGLAGEEGTVPEGERAAGGAGHVINAVQAVLQAGVAEAGGILAEVRVFYLTNRRAAVSIKRISIVTGLVPPGHPVPADLGAQIVCSVEGKAVVAPSAVYGVADQVTGKALHDLGAVCIADKVRRIPVGKVVT